MYLITHVNANKNTDYWVDDALTLYTIQKYIKTSITKKGYGCKGT
jgi:hypothetical protein